MPYLVQDMLSSFVFCLSLSHTVLFSLCCMLPFGFVLSLSEKPTHQFSQAKRERERERESVCVCVCVREREREGGREKMRLLE